LAKRKCSNVKTMMQSIKKLFRQELPYFFLAPALLWQLLFLYIPLAVIVYYSFVSGASGALFTTAHYAELLSWPYVCIIARSLFLASATALITLLLAYPLVYYIVFHARAYRRQLLILLMVPFWINVLVLAYAWFFLLERNGLINALLMRLGLISDPLNFVYSLGAALTVMVYCYLPFMIMSLYISLEKLDERLFEASADLGATVWQTFTRVTLPLSLPGIKTGLLLVFVPAFGEFAVPTLLGGSKFLVVGSLISYYFFVARNNGVAAAFTVVAGIFLLLFVMLVAKIIMAYCNFRRIQQ
jgi:spermidine/putrescine transport system permease protein